MHDYLPLFGVRVFLGDAARKVAAGLSPRLVDEGLKHLVAEFHDLSVEKTIKNGTLVYLYGGYELGRKMCLGILLARNNKHPGYHILVETSCGMK